MTRGEGKCFETQKYSSDRSEDEMIQGHQFFLVECNYFLKPPIQIKGGLVMVYIQ